MSHILCAGIAVLDEIFRVRVLPSPGQKVKATDFAVVAGGCAANAAVAIARLGGKATLVAPLGGPAGEDVHGDRVLAALKREGVDCTGCARVPGAKTAISGIFVDIHGERAISTYNERGLDEATLDQPNDLVAGVDAVLVDNHFPKFVTPLCNAASDRGIPVVLDADKATLDCDPLFNHAGYVIFSAECLRVTSRTDDLAMGLHHMRRFTNAFLAVTDGPRPIHWHDGCLVREMPVFPIEAVDTLAAGDVFHGAFALALVQGQPIESAMRFAAAAAGLKCSKFGAGTSAPHRPEVEALLARTSSSLRP